MGKKKAGKTKESQKEGDQRPGSTRSGVNYQPRTSAERGAAIFTKGHINPRELADMYRDYGLEEGEDWGARNTDDEDDEAGLAARAQQPTAQDEQQGTGSTMPGPTGSDRPGATQRPTQAVSTFYFARSSLT